MSTPERRAYRDAWRLRQQTGDYSSALLLRKLEDHGADPVWSEPDGELHRWLMDCWDRGVSPMALGVEAAKQAATLLPRITKPFRDLLRHFR